MHLQCRHLYLLWRHFIEKSCLWRHKVENEPKIDETLPCDENKIEIIPIYADLQEATKTYEVEKSDASLLIKNVEKCNFTIKGPCSSFTLENATDTVITMEDVTFGKWSFAKTF